MSRFLRSAVKKALGYQSWNSDEDQARFLADATTIFDVGANVGQTAKAYRRLFPNAAIWSFEPFPDAYAKLRDALPDSNFHPVQKALSDETATSRLNLGAGSVTNSLLRRQTDTGTSIEIQTDTLDHFCMEQRISSIDILKVDVEGAESRVFKGAETMLSQGKVRAVFTEVYFDPVYDGMALMWDLHALLCPLGFSLRGLYSLNAGRSGCLSFGNALYLRQSDLDRVQSISS